MKFIFFPFIYEILNLSMTIIIGDFPDLYKSIKNNVGNIHSCTKLKKAFLTGSTFFLLFAFLYFDKQHIKHYFFSVKYFSKLLPPPQSLCGMSCNYSLQLSTAHSSVHCLVCLFWAEGVSCVILYHLHKLPFLCLYFCYCLILVCSFDLVS